MDLFTTTFRVTNMLTVFAWAMDTDNPPANRAKATICSLLNFFFILILLIFVLSGTIITFSVTTHGVSAITSLTPVIVTGYRVP